MKFRVGDGSKIFLWLDLWHLDGVLYDLYGYKVIYDTRSKLDANLSRIIRGINWNWLPARSYTLVAIQRKLHFINLGRGGGAVILQSGWLLKSIIYSSRDAWEALREKQPEVEWCSLIRFSMAIPKHSFILWQAMKDFLLVIAF